VLACIVPIKAFTSAKTRLAGLLDEDQRAALARVSAHRVLKAAEACGAIGLRLAVVEDEATAEFARMYFFEPLLRPELWGQSAAVDAGFDEARARGATAVMTVSADVPLTRPLDLLQLSERAGLTLVTDREGTGTNALHLAPPRPFRLHFGPGSLDQHRREAAAEGIEVHLLDNARLRLDLDSPADVDALEKIGPEGREVLVQAGQLRLDAEKQLHGA